MQYITRKGYSGLPEALKTRTEKSKEVAEFKVRDLEVKALIDSEYPLLREISSWTRNHKELVFYANAKFEAQKGN